MRNRNLIFVALVITNLVLGACTAAPIQPASSIQPDSKPLTKIQIAATAQAQVNLLQKEAYELEKTLEEKLPDKYTGMLVKSGDTLRVDVYLNNGSIEDLKPYVADPELLKVTQVLPTEASRKEMRAYREMIKAKLAELGTEITTSILMEPARLEIYTTDKTKTARVLEENQITLPGYTVLIEQTILDTGG